MASVAVVAALAGGTASATVPGAEKLQLGPPLGSPERVIAYGGSRLLLFGTGPTIRRINRDGSPDQSFGDGGEVQISSVPGAMTWSRPDVTVAPEGKILLTLTGSSPSEPSGTDAQVTRLLPNGKPDPTFGPEGTVEVDFGGNFDRGQTAAVGADGDVLVAGIKQTVPSNRRVSNETPAIARLLPNGALDRSFGDDGIAVLHGGWEGGVFDLAPTVEGGVVVEGEAFIGTAIWKLTASGSVDRSFGKGGEVEIQGRGHETEYGWQEELEMVHQVAVLPSGNPARRHR